MPVCPGEVVLASNRLTSSSAVNPVRPANPTSVIAECLAASRLRLAWWSSRAKPGVGDLRARKVEVLDRGERPDRGQATIADRAALDREHPQRREFADWRQVIDPRAVQPRAGSSRSSSPGFRVPPS